MTSDTTYHINADQIYHAGQQTQDSLVLKPNQRLNEQNLTLTGQDTNYQSPTFQDFYQCSNLFVSRYTLNNLIASAMPVIALMNRVNLIEDSYAAVCSFDQLLTHEMQAFESQCYKHEYAPHTIQVATYCLCAFIDDFIYNCHLQYYYDEREGYLYRYFQVSPGQEQLTRLLDNAQFTPLAYVETLELVFLLFNMRYEGSFKTSTTYYKQRLKLMDELYQQIQSLRGETTNIDTYEPCLIASNHQHQSRFHLPFSIAVLSGLNLLLLGTIYGLLTWS